MEIKAGNYCPLLQKECIGLQCAWITQVRGTDPNTGNEVDHWDCAVKWVPMLLIENSQQQRQTGAAIESLRNETVDRLTPSIELQKLPIKINENFDNS
tara:strand:+ start:899 stop:1192 length:294 start_codon:yes stop_codon:yes gene_type:complete